MKVFLALMYHHINSDKYSNNIEIINKHFEYISKNYKTSFLGDDFDGNLLLIFDDGFYDFYYYVYPLLRQYNLKAILSIPTKYIIDTTSIESEKRLNLKHSDIMYDKRTLDLVPFCTWQEIKEMSDSGYVQIASHSVNHIDLTQCDDKQIEFELKESKKIIEDKLAVKCDVLTYPYGSFNKKIKQVVKNYYNFDIAIGSIYNFSVYKTIYRIYGDDLKDCCSIFKGINKLKYILRNVKWLINGRFK